MLSGGPNSRTLQAKTFTYDSYGRVASLVLPQGYTYNTFSYDGEDETTGYNRTNAYCDGAPCRDASRTQTYTVRGELTVVHDSTASLNSTQASADGTLVTEGNGVPYDGFDARSGMILDKNAASGPGTPYAYDAAGRQTQVTNNYPSASSPSYATRAYDAENHVVSQAYSGSSFECPSSGQLEMCGGWPGGTGDSGIVSSGTVNTYGWGPNGHPIALTGNYAGPAAYNVSVHWDGDDILFENSQNGLVDVQVGKLTAGTGSSDFTISDRDMTGQQVSSHTATEFGAWDGGSPTRQCAACAKGREGGRSIPGSVESTYDSVNGSSYFSATTYLSGVREDGYNDGFGNTFQGVRAYDGNLGQWTSPDAYAGDVHDPISQKPFMWNRNTPTEYSDPSGYCPLCIIVILAGELLTASEASAPAVESETTAATEATEAEGTAAVTQALSRGAGQGPAAARGGNYRVLNSAGQILRNGRTNDLVRRAGENISRLGSNVTVRTMFRTDDKLVQRGLEQLLQLAGRGQLDKIAAVAKNNPNKATTFKPR